MKITWITFGVGWLAIIGIPPLSGFFTKEPIIAAAFEREGWTGWLFGMAALLGAGLTAFYMTRLFVLTFHGPKRWTEDIQHPHESPPIMTIPLILLAVGSVGAGWPDGHVGAGLARRRCFGADGRGARTASSATPPITVAVAGADRARRRPRLGAVPQRHRAGRSSRPARWSPPPAATSTPTPSTRRSSRSPAAT